MSMIGGNTMERYNMTVGQFVNNFLPSNAKIKVVKSFDTVFDGTLEELHYYGYDALDLIVAMVGAEEDKVYLSCRNR